MSGASEGVSPSEAFALSLSASTSLKLIVGSLAAAAVLSLAAGFNVGLFLLL